MSATSLDRPTISTDQRRAIERARDILVGGGVRYDGSKIIREAGRPPRDTTMNLSGLVALLALNDLVLPQIVTVERAVEASHYVLRQWPAYDETGRTIRPLGRLFDSGTGLDLDPARAIAAIDRFLAGDHDDPWRLAVAA